MVAQHELDEFPDTIAAMTEEMNALREQLAAAELVGDEQAKAEGAALIAELRAKNKSLVAELDELKASRNACMFENAQLKSRALSQRQKLKKLGH